MELVIPIRQRMIDPKLATKPFEEKRDQDEQVDNILLLLLMLYGVSMAETKHQRMELAITKLDKVEGALKKLMEDLNKKLEALSELANTPEGVSIDRVLLAQLQEEYKNMTAEISKRNNDALRVGEIDVKGVQKSIEAATHMGAGLIRLNAAAIRVANRSLR